MHVLVRVCVSSVSLACWLGVALAADGNGNGIADEWGEEVEGFSLSLRMPKQEYVSSEPITCVISLRNNSPGERKVFTSSLFGTYRLSVLLADGTPAPMTLRGKRSAASARESSWSSRLVEPGGALFVAYDRVNALFDMTLSGDYKVSVSTKIPKAQASGYAQVVSNAVLVRVVESPMGDSGRWIRDEGEAEKLLRSTTYAKDRPRSPAGRSPAPKAVSSPPKPESPVEPAEVPSPPADTESVQQTYGSRVPWLVGVIGVLAGTGLGALLAWALLRRKYSAS